MIQIVTKLVTKMSPTYNDHFRQATKMVTKNRRFKCRRISLEVVGGYYYFATFAMSHSVDFTTLLPKLFKTYEMPAVGPVTPSSAWKPNNIGNPLTVTGLDPNATYTVIANTPWTEGKGEFRFNITGADSYQQRPYNSTGVLIPVVYQIQGVKPTSSGSLTFQRAYSGEVFNVRTAQLYISLIRTA